ncbi:hypothetical protein [Microbacterium sp. lyk4-40-TSB-66]|uniref:hypothetical protein n=1 Tax=Microbacterium sp. lyk4-40-TSB-66 TaxID=3040294 RepID=UPI00254F55C9|nr:hypothetical protein [Microbacterium sp. lyk4-40-TSB-66]
MLRSRTAARSRRYLKYPAAVLAGAVIVAGNVVAAPAPAQAAWEDDAQSWITSMQTGLGWAEGLFGLKTGPWNTALSIASPLISAIFGGSSAPSIGDVLERLKQLDDIEHKIDQVQNSLVTIEAEIATVGQDVLTGTCAVQASRPRDYLAKLAAANDAYANVVDKIDEVRVGTAGEDDLKVAINSFIAYTTGESEAILPDHSAFAESLRSVHADMGTTGGVAGIIQSCGRAYLNDWKIENTSAAALSGMPANDHGAWLDDRDYYDPLQKLVSFWQTAVAQGTYLHQQASLMRVSREYVTAHGPLSVEDSARVCALAKTNGPAMARATCEGGLIFAKTVYSGFAAEWREVGVPISDANVVMNMGTDVHGLSYQPTTPRAAGTPAEDPLPSAGAPVGVASRVWARDPATFPAAWTTGTWSTTAGAVLAYGIDGFVPAGSSQWSDLSNGYRATHPTVQTTTRAEAMQWRSSTGWQSSGVDPFAPLDILTVMKDSVAPAATGTDPAHAFTVKADTTVWMPNEAASHDFPMWRSPIPEWSRGTGLSFPHSRLWLKFDFPPRVLDDAKMSVKCFVATEDGIVCHESVASWWVNRLSIEPSLSVQNLNRITPLNPEVDSMVMLDKERECRGEPHFDQECATIIDQMFTTRGESFAQSGPSWLAPIDAANGQHYEGDPAAAGTLWPSAPVPDCALTTWGAKTRCGPALEAWITSHVPNPSLSGPVATTDVTVDRAADGTAVCIAPAWNTSSVMQYGDVAWTAWSRTGKPFTKVVPFGSHLDLLALVTDAGWNTGGAAGESGRITLRCSFTARTAEVANETEVRSATVAAVRVDDHYDFPSVGVGTPGDPGATPGAGVTPDPTDATPVGTAESSASGASAHDMAARSVDASGRKVLASSGIGGEPWPAAAGALVLLVFGASLMVCVRTRRARRSA